MFEDLLQDFDFSWLAEVLSEWASIARNWIERFFSFIFDKISDWLDVLSEKIEEFFQSLEGTEADPRVIIADLRTEIGRRISDALNGRDREAIRDGDNITLSLADGEIKNVSSYQAGVVENPEKFKEMMRENDGVIVVKN